MSRMFIVKKSLEISSQQWREHSTGVVDIVLCVTGLYYCPQAAEMLHWAPDTSTRNTQNSIFLKLFWYYIHAHVAVLFCFVFSVYCEQADEVTIITVGTLKTRLYWSAQRQPSESTMSLSVQRSPSRTSDIDSVFLWTWTWATSLGNAHSPLNCFYFFYFFPQ